MPHPALRRALIAALAAALACTHAAATLYKWVDDKGVTHYSESPPPDGKATKLDIPDQPGPSGKDTPENWKQRELDLRRERIEKQQAEDKADAQKARNTELRHERCLEARRRLDVLAPGHPVYRVNEKGERVYMDDEERAAKAREMQKYADAYCDS